MLVQLLKENTVNIDCLLLPSMGAVTVVQQAFRHGGYVPHLSDCIGALYRKSVLSYDQSKPRTGQI